jgi:uncharacterized protein
MSFKRRTPGGKTRPLSLEQLEIWLGNLNPPAAGVSAIDGFLAAIAVSPRFIEPEKWMRSILGERARNVLEGTRMASAIRTITERYDEICGVLAFRPEAYAPIYMRTDDGEVLLENWATGFFTGVNLALGNWKPFIDDPSTGYPLAAIIGHSSQAEGKTFIEQVDNPETTEALAETWRYVPEIVSLLHDRCLQARVASMS